VSGRAAPQQLLERVERHRRNADHPPAVQVDPERHDRQGDEQESARPRVVAIAIDLRQHHGQEQHRVEARPDGGECHLPEQDGDRGAERDDHRGGAATSRVGRDERHGG
jgi:hypothetical protein